MSDLDGSSEDRGPDVSSPLKTPPQIDTRIAVIAFTVVFGVIVFGREMVTWMRGAEPNLGRAAVMFLAGGVIIAAAYRGYTRQHIAPMAPEWIQAGVTFIALSMVFVIYGIVLRSDLAVVFPAASISAAAVTLAIVVRRTALFLLLAPLICGVVGFLVSPLLSVFSMNPDVDAYDGFTLGVIVGLIGGLPPWYMLRAAGTAGPQTMTIGLLLALLMIPWIVTTAAIR